MPKRQSSQRTEIVHLARSARGDALALARLLAAGDGNAAPGPVAAGGAKDVDLLGIRGDAALDVLDREVRDRDAVGGSAWQAFRQQVVSGVVEVEVGAGSGVKARGASIPVGEPFS